MDAKTVRRLNCHLRSCKEECSSPLEGEIKGEIPKWLNGSLIRIGSGLLQIGPDSYNHLFDGMALIHRFSFQDGKVTYQNKFLRSDEYCANIKANRIVKDEFATRGVPDPCKTIFQRLTSFFDSGGEFPDNAAINIILYGNEAYACSESDSIWKVDPETLESIQKVKLNHFVPVTLAIAHAHEDLDGTIYNVGSTFSVQPHYKILKFPPKDKESGDTFQNASVVCDIPSSKYLTLSYHHSFGMSENYFVFIEQPLYLSLPKMAWKLGTGKTYADVLTWDETRNCRFHIVRRVDGKLLDTVYIAKSFFVFHHINAYEDNDNLIVDLCVYKDGTVINDLYLKALEEFTKNNVDKDHSSPMNSFANRFVLPLNLEEKMNKENLVKLAGSSATAVRLEDGSIFCSPEKLINDWFIELPRINYKKYNGKKYRYYYSIATKNNLPGSHLLKADVVTGNTISWYEIGISPSEPVFLANQSSDNKDEDSGVILASLLYKNDENKVSLLVLDAKSMKEIGRATFLTKSSVPSTFHGTFIEKS